MGQITKRGQKNGGRLRPASLLEATVALPGISRTFPQGVWIKIAATAGFPTRFLGGIFQLKISYIRNFHPSKEPGASTLLLCRENVLFPIPTTLQASATVYPAANRPWACLIFSASSSP